MKQDEILQDTPSDDQNEQFYMDMEYYINININF